MRILTRLAPSLLAFLLVPAVASAGYCDAYFTFDGNIADSSGNGYDGTLIEQGGKPASGSPSYGEGKNGQALLLDGSSALRVPLDLSKEACPQVTISAWVKFDDHPTKGTQYIFSSGRNGPGFDRAGTHLEVRSGDQRQLVSNALRGGRWEFIAAAIDQEQGKMTVYWRQRSYERDMKPVGTKAADIWIGAIGDDLRSPVLAGAIDDVRVLGQMLTADQVKQLQNNVGQVGVMPKPTGLDQGPSAAADRVAEAGVMPKPTVLAQPPDIGDGTAEAGALPKLFGDPDLPPDIGDGTGDQAVVVNHEEQYFAPDIGDGYAAAGSEQMVMAGQTDSLPGSGNLDGSSDTPTSLMPGGSRGTDLSSNESLQQAVDEKAPLDLTYDSEEEGEAAAAAAAARRAEEATTLSGYTLSDDVVKSGLVGKSGTSVRPLDLRSEPFHKILIERLDWEMGHVPDRVRIVGKTKSKYALQYLTNNCPDLGSCSDDYNVVTMNEAHIAPASATAIGVCLTLVDNKVAGVELRGHVLEPDGTLDEYYKDTDTRGQCANWSTLTACGLDYVATGVEVHFRETGAAANVDHKVTGLQLLCRRIVKN